MHYVFTLSVLWPLRLQIRVSLRQVFRMELIATLPCSQSCSQSCNATFYYFIHGLASLRWQTGWSPPELRYHQVAHALNSGIIKWRAMPRLAEDFTLEIHVSQLHGTETKIIKYTCDRDVSTMKSVLHRAMYSYPAPQYCAPKLTLCGLVLDADSAELSMQVGKFVEWYCADYKKHTAKQHLDATLIFEFQNHDAPVVAWADVEARLGSWWRTMRGCTGYDALPEERLGHDAWLIARDWWIPTDTYIGPVTAVKQTERYVSVFVKGWWIDVWIRTHGKKD